MRRRERIDHDLLFPVPLSGVEHHYMRLVAADVLARYQQQEKVC